MDDESDGLELLEGLELEFALEVELELELGLDLVLALSTVPPSDLMRSSTWAAASVLP